MKQRIPKKVVTELTDTVFRYGIYTAMAVVIIITLACVMRIAIWIIQL